MAPIRERQERPGVPLATLQDNAALPPNIKPTHLTITPGDDSTMRVLVIGGCGYVGSLVCPLLAPQHALRFFDLKPPATEPENFLGFQEGNVGDSQALEAACE